jgi:Putative peptidoglycan binding domain
MITNPANTTLRGPLFLGSNSDDVKRMQQSLNERSRTILTANVFPLSADGAFGMKTDKGVRAFQSFQKLAVDGIVGKKTSAALGFSNFIEAPRPAYVPPMRPPGVDPIMPQNGQAGPARPQDSPLHQIAHELGKIYSILANEVANYFRKIGNLIDINIERYVNRWIHMVKNISGSVYTNLINLGNNIQAAGQFIRNSSRQIAEEMRALVQGACGESVILTAVLGPSEARMYSSIINIGNGAERVCSGAGGTVTDFANSGLSLVYGLLGTLGAIVKEYA